MSPALTSAPITPEAGAGEQSRRELENRLAGVSGLSVKKLSPEAKAKKLREACEGFESVFIQKMWQEMRNTLPKGGMLHGREERFWQDMYDQELAKSMTSAGGIGLADMMYAQLSRNLGDLSRDSAGEEQRLSAFVPEAAPLLPQAESPAQKEEQAAQASRQATARAASGQGMISGPDAASLSPLSPTAASQVAAAAGGERQEQAGEDPAIQLALASIRAQQALRQQAEDARLAQKAAPSTRQAPTGIELAQRAMRDAGDKIGPGAVRPRLQPAAGAQQAAPAEDGKNLIVLPGSPEGTAAQNASMQAASDLAARIAAGPVQGAEASQPQVTRITRTTNIPPSRRMRQTGQQPIRTLSTDGTAPGARAGAGLAAYHQAQAQANPAAGAQAPQAAQNVQGAAAEQAGFVIPPLTAS